MTNYWIVKALEDSSTLYKIKSKSQKLEVRDYQTNAVFHGHYESIVLLLFLLSALQVINNLFIS